MSVSRPVEPAGFLNTPSTISVANKSAMTIFLKSPPRISFVALPICIGSRLLLES